MLKTYRQLGYQMSQILSPDEVLKRDASLSNFVKFHSQGAPDNRRWNNDSIAVWRPGGCLDTQKFIPKLVQYLEKKLGKDRFSINFNKKVTGIIFDESNTDSPAIKGLEFADQTTIEKDPKNTFYSFCPGEAVGTLERLSLNEPAYAGFAGASLSLNVDIPEQEKEFYEKFGHYMEVHKEGVVLAWQARIRDGEIFVGVAGTKAFYGDVEPKLDHPFAKDRNLLQLQMINDVLPHIVSLALRRDTTGQTLKAKDLEELVKAGIAVRWVGRRSVVYDGFPTIGRVYRKGRAISNAQTVTHLGSGGGSFSHIMSLLSDYALDPESYKSEIIRLNLSEEFVERVLKLSDSRRMANR
jgi:hypothetical protein